MNNAAAHAASTEDGLMANGTVTAKTVTITRSKRITTQRRVRSMRRGDTYGV